MSEEKTKIEQAKEKCLDAIITGANMKEGAEAYATLVNAEFTQWQIDKAKPTPQE